MPKYCCSAYLDKRCAGCGSVMANNHSAPHNKTASCTDNTAGCGGSKDGKFVEGSVDCRPITELEEAALNL
jgi:hypothetical protein